MDVNRQLAKALFVGFALNVSVPAMAAAENWPTRPVTMVIPFAAGSGGDVLGRILAPRLSELLGQPVIVENVGGAGGMIGALRVAKAKPDGYQFVLGNVGTHAQNQALYKTPPYNATVDFAPVALIAAQPIVLITRRDLPARDLQEFIAYAKTNQARMHYGSAGVGSAAHLACVLLNAAIGVETTHIPYRGGAEAMQDLIAGRLDYQCPFIAIAIPQIASGFVRPIAVLSSRRSPILPDVASAREQGLPDFDVGAWVAIFLPKGTPEGVISKLHDATVSTMDTPAVRERLRAVGAELVAPEQRSPEYLQQFVKAEIRKWDAAIKAAKISAE